MTLIEIGLLRAYAGRPLAAPLLKYGVRNWWEQLEGAMVSETRTTRATTSPMARNRLKLRLLNIFVSSIGWVGLCPIYDNSLQAPVLHRIFQRVFSVFLVCETWLEIFPTNNSTC